MRLLLFTALFVCAGINAFAQPTVFNSSLADGATFVSYNLTDRGAFRQLRLSSTTAGGALTRNWNFSGGTAASPDYTNNWRPYSGSCNSNPNLQIPGYNQVIAPAAGFPAPYASATFNSSFGGCDGFLPAVTANTVYTVNVTENAGNNHMGILATAYQPRTINSVFGPPCASVCGARVNVSLSGVPAAGEYAYVRYTTDGFVTSGLAEVVFPISVATGTATIPDQGNNTVVYYAFTSPNTLSELNSAVATHGSLAYDMLTLELRNNVGNNYSYIRCTDPVSFTAIPTDASSVNASDGRIQINPTGGSGSYQFSIDNGASWEFSIPIPISSYTFFLLSPGSYPVLVRDANRCPSAVQMVTVGPCAPPTAQCNNLTVSLDNTGNASILPADVDNGSTAPCGGLGLSLDQSSFTCFDLGNRTVTLTVTDVNASSSSCTATVTVSNTANPGVCDLLSKEIVGTSEIGSSESGNGSPGNERQVLIGERVSYRLLLEVPEGTAQNVVITDLLPAGLQYVSGSAQFTGSSDNVLSYSTTVTGGGASGADVSFGLGTVINNDQDANAETIEITFDAIVLNESGNQDGTLMANQAQLSVGGNPIATSETRTVRVAEPVLQVEKEQRATYQGAFVTSGDAGDEYVYTVRVQNTGNAPAYDVRLSDFIAIDFVSQYGVVIATGPPGFGFVFNAVTGEWNLDWSEIGAGITVSATLQVRVNTTVRPLDSWANTVDISFSSLSGVNADERTDADGSGGALNDYKVSATSPVFTVPEPAVAKQVEHPSQTPVAAFFGGTYSDNSTDPSTNISAYNTNVVDAAIGETFSYLITVTFPEGTTADFKMIDVISPNGQTGGRQLRVVDMLSAEVIYVGANLSGEGVRPLGTFFNVTDSNPADGDGTSCQMYTGGNIDVLNTPDNTVDDKDRYVIRITARMDDEDDSGGPADDVAAPVANRDGDVTGNRLQYQWRKADNTQLTRNLVADVEIVEPVINLSKAVTATNGNGVITNGNLDGALPGDQLTFTFTLANNGTGAAYDVALLDYLDPVFDLLSVNTTGGVDNSDLTADEVNLSIASIPAGTTITVTAVVSIRNTASLGTTYTNTANAAYQSQPGTGLDIRSYSSSDQASVSIPSCIVTISNVSPSPEGCPGAEDGAISVTANSSLFNSLTYALTGPENASNQNGLFSGLMSGTYSLTVSDNSVSGCSATQTNIMVVAGVDNQPPTISCPSNISANAASGLCSAVASYTAPTGSDNCPGAGTSQTAGQASGTAFPVGSTLNTFVVTAANGQTASCSFTVTVTDNQPPAINCPSNISVSNDAGNCSALVSFTAPVGADNCPGAGTSQTAGQASGTAFPVGSTLNTFVVTAANGQTASCSFTVTVTDNQPPAINCPANISVNNDAGNCSALVSFTTPVGADNCPGAGTSQTAGQASGTAFPVGSTLNTFVVTAANGQTASCSFTVTVTDNQPPAINCPANISVNNDAGNCSALVSFTAPVGADNCPGAGTSQTAGQASGTAFPVGNTLNTFVVTAANGQTASCSFTVTVTDNQPPAINCPSNISVNNDAGNCSALVSFTAPVGADNCPGAGTSQTAGQASGTAFPVGSTLNTFVVTAANGQTASCSFTVTVTDNQPPAINCPSNISVNNDAGNCSALVSFTAPVGADNCPGAGTSQTAGQASGTAFPVGSTLNTFVVTAANGQTASCSFTVTVTDNQPPAINCPSNISVNNDAGNCSALVSFTAPVGADNCPGAGTSQTAGLASGSSFPAGSTSNTFVVTAANGQTASCSFTVTVTDNQPPVISCPANLTVCSNPATNTWTGIGLSPLALSDNCGAPTLEHSLNTQAYQNGNANGRSFAVGTTTVTYRASDGNSSVICSFSVTVRKTPGASWSQTALSICNGASINLASYARDSRNAAKRYNFYSGDANGNNLQFLGTVTASNGTVNFGQNRVVLPAGNNSMPVLHYYYLVAVNTFANGPSCEGPRSGALVVTVNPVPMLTPNVIPSGQICPGNAVNISFNSSIPATVFWSNNNTGIGLAANGTGNISFNATAPGAATIFAQASSGACGSAPLSIPLTVSSCSQSRMTGPGADPFGGAGAPQLYPNPSNGQLFLRLPESSSPVLYATRIEFFDAAGRRVWSEAFELAGGAERRLDLSRLAAGVYGWTLRVGDAGYNGRVVKE